MAGGFERIGQRRTYFPPFVNELFGEPPYWSCTFASLLNGVNVGAFGTKPSSYGEVRRLAHASGDADLRGGSRSSHMVRALKVAYGYQGRIVALPPKQVQYRLAHGWAMVAGLTYGDLPKRLRRGTFTGGHRVVVLGWDKDRTRLLDPLQPRDEGFHGLWVTWNEFSSAWWSTEQLWFREGSLLPPPKLGALSPVQPARAWRADKGAVLALRDPAKGGAVVKRLRLTANVESTFDAVARLVPPKASLADTLTLVRVAKGSHAGLLVNANAPRVHADTTMLPEAVVQGIRIAAQQDLWDTIAKTVDPATLPPRPAAPA